METSPPFSAVLLAGGASSRMGRDKAGLVLQGESLWRRQLATLRATGPRELFISGKSDGPYAHAGVEIIPDNFPGCGPLAGLEAALRRSDCPLLLVLAIDLPAMTTAWLRTLVPLALATPRGVVPRSPRGFEPLAAIYPRACLPLIEQRLRAGELALQPFVRSLADQALISIRELPPSETFLFENVNSPSDLLEGGAPARP